MKIKIFFQDQADFMDILLIGDEQAEMVQRYLNQGPLFALFDEQRLLGVALAVPQSEKTLELKNIAIVPAKQHQGFGRQLMQAVENYAKNQGYQTLTLGTGESPLTLPFYQKLGYQYSHRIKNFFKQNYDHPIIEGGHELKDMIYLSKTLH
ncbi:GNAT family N-acetyltransferase [Agrilactobacillus fermenti]|uniref:GNAT family N-acetyltransferase n=1 Tax=Agrilactobacillus fermenti TaxID=2586909 RepID=UPI001E3E7153|nr:GNAT family N-acetyltransferase [Agrilactobacillus fermenti]MCD2256733.1 GNAT family N-acetyltransferase [Agrilactobacillus fermenti]